MKIIKYILPIVLAALLLIASKEKPIHIFMAGDSTMALKPLYKNVYDSISGDSIKEPFLEKGWGQLLPEFFNNNILVDNFAQNGRSSRLFIEQGWWDKLISKVQRGDYVIIQFGHNDSAEDRPDRYTTPKEYTENLSRFVKEIEDKGGKPIICTSVVRRRFDKKGEFKDSHGIYLDLARQVAINNNIPMIDMYEMSKKLLINLGDEKSIPLFLHILKGENRNFPNGKIDNTHFREKGAREMAALFIQGLQENQITDLTQNLK